MHTSTFHQNKNPPRTLTELGLAESLEHGVIHNGVVAIPPLTIRPVEELESNTLVVLRA